MYSPLLFAVGIGLVMLSVVVSDGVLGFFMATVGFFLACHGGANRS